MLYIKKRIVLFLPILLLFLLLFSDCLINENRGKIIPIDSSSRLVIYADNADDYISKVSNTSWHNWGKSTIVNYSGTTAEGTNAKSIRNNNSSNSWWGCYVSALSSENISSFINGCLVFSINTTYDSPFYVGIKSGTAPSGQDGYVLLKSGLFGFYNDGNWHDVTIPLNYIMDINKYVVPSDITSYFVIRDESPEGLTNPIYIDNIYFSRSGGDWELPTPTAPEPNISVDTWSPGAGWSLSWSDEFSDTSINTDNWGHLVGHGSNGWGNNEFEYYTSSTSNSFIKEWSGNGYLIIKAIYTCDDVSSSQLAARNYTSARLHTQGHQAFWYNSGKVKIAARIQLPYGQGIWPAFWMLGDDFVQASSACGDTSNSGSTSWLQAGEIDILEMVGGGEGKDDTHVGNLHWYDTTVSGNWGNFNGAIDTQLSDPDIFADAFHVFEIEWDSSQIIWKLDGVQFDSRPITDAEMNEFHGPFHILLNVAVGGGWPGNPNLSTVFPQYMYVDWVRVYTM